MMRFQRLTAFTAAIILCTACSAAFAVGPDKALPAQPGKPPPPAPNLTVNLTLNSALDAEQTAYYARLAEELIARLPREFKAPPPPGAPHGSVAEHLNVVTYLPSLADDPHSTGLDKRIQYFKVKFTFDGTSPQPTAATISPEPAPDMPEQVLDEGALNVASILQPPNENVPKPEVETDTGMSVVGAGMMTRLAEEQRAAALAAQELAKAKAERAEQNKKQPAAKTAAAKPVLTPAPAQTATPAATVASQRPTTPAPAPVGARTIRLTYKSDVLELDASERQKLLEFVQKSRAAEGVIGYNIVARTNAGPFGDMDWLGDERVRLLGGLMRQHGLDMYQGRLNEIHVTTQGEQYIDIEQIRG
jgi:hypothetical protein